jgi:hypothetical protein
MSEALRSRRSFLKTAAASAAGLAVAGPAVETVLGKIGATKAWTTGMAINPNISNLRVVCMYDPKMVTNANLNTFSLNTYVGATDKAVIATDMDCMAMSLAQKTKPADAWSAIFQKPAAKTWAQVKVAIKVNGCNAYNLPRLAVVEKICRVLNGMGVLGANIIVYDGALGTCGWDTISNYTPFFSTDGTGTYNGYAKIPGVTSSKSSGLGGTVSAAIPNKGSGNCPAYLANGTIDILVNIAVNKGHTTPTNGGVNQGNTGGATLCLKNHFGTFPVFHNNSNPSTGDYAVYLNMSDAIVGGTPPRQQLNIVDSLWADNNNTPDGRTPVVVSRLVMGTFAGAVDYLTCLKVKQDIMITQMKQPNNMDFNQINRFLTLFGYTTIDAALTWVPITPCVVSDIPKYFGAPQSRTFEVRLTGRKGEAAMTRFELPQETKGNLDVQIFDIRGRSVRKLSAQIQESQTALSWNGKNENGNTVGAGIYEVRVSSEHYTDVGKIIIE